ncbi:hypothetical protein OM076_16190 [Solirubrobacter ginsenosidimutans]|uniref:Uncharacterized protein n=1 Tax=Solirubrobacter ginsenosidimutans TaxID=490573 RepID=A0A9X3MSI8_9ACTN|nr:hypothetical protein [Solirubrobacter ginsenosidimutans]MDA0161814.1 hypothetical protein [Solirubrobacter ginsenosidimutans]
MAGELCLDTTPLIHFEQAGLLSTLEELCQRVGETFAPVTVVGEWHPHAVAPEGHVVGHPWITTVTADHPADLRIVADLGNRYPTPPNRNQGEMDVVAISHRLGYTALMEDLVGCRQADDYGVPHIAIVTMLAAAVAYEHVEQRTAWRVHRDVEATRGTYHSILLADSIAKRGFTGAVAAFRALRRRHDPGFSAFLALPNRDGILLAAARAAMDRAG